MNGIFIPNPTPNIVDFSIYKKEFSDIENLIFKIDSEIDTNKIFNEIKEAFNLLKLVGIDISYEKNKINESYFKIDNENSKTLEIGLTDEYSIYASLISIFGNTNFDALFNIVNNFLDKKNTQDLYEIYLIVYRTMKDYRNIKYSEQIILTIFNVINTLLENRGYIVELQPILIEIKK